MARAERFVSLGQTGSERSCVMVAEAGRELVGIARFSPSPHKDPHVMDVGIVITDAWQGRGLGGQVLRQLVAEAQAREVTTFSAVVLWENRRMLRLAHRLFPDLRRECAAGTCDITIDIVSWRRGETVTGG
jgi:RimJ/RimL family protein N-acetyltransferase